jgi:tRNA pseudouridine38-40 synthase
MSRAERGTTVDPAVVVPVARDRAEVRLRLAVAYDGTDFSGWAAQPGRRTVQGTLEDALAMILRLPEARLTVAGRTDAGVHARGQVCHVDVAAEALAGPAMTVDRLTSRLASALPADVRVRSVTLAPAGFDARFSASWRRYAYRICDDPSAVDPLTRGHILTWPRRLDETAMNAAATLLVGQHDFAAFCKRREGATTVRALHRLEWVRDGGVLCAGVVADAFCHHMVRSLVGALVEVGEGRRPQDWPGQVLAAGRRDSRVPVVPACGLTLEEVRYPVDGELAARAREARSVRTMT